MVTTYALSGELVEGDSTVTVSYGGKTTTFTVDVTRYVMYDYIYNSANVDSEYVNTGLTYRWTTLNLEFEALNNNPKTASDGLIGANNTNTSDTKNIIWYGRASKGGFSTYSLGVAKQLSTVPENTRAVCKYFFVDGGESYIQYEDTVVAVATVSESSIGDNIKPLLLAGTYTVSGNNSPYGMKGERGCKLGYVKFSDPSTDNVVYNFIPAHDLQNNKYGFYETVHSVFYPSNGSNFRCGNWE